jgi:rhodanese-related sulfurtransferase
VRASPTRIDAATARDLVSDGALLVDVRRRDDPAMTIAGAVRISPEEIPERLDELPRDSPIVLACG